MSKIIEKLKSVYYIFTKHYKLIWRDNPFPTNQKYIGCFIVYENTICGPVEWGDVVPQEVVKALKEIVLELEEKDAKN